MWSAGGGVRAPISDHFSTATADSVQQEHAWLCWTIVNNTMFAQIYQLKSLKPTGPVCSIYSLVPILNFLETHDTCPAPNNSSPARFLVQAATAACAHVLTTSIKVLILILFII